MSKITEQALSSILQPVVLSLTEFRCEVLRDESLDGSYTYPKLWIMVQRTAQSPVAILLATGPVLILRQSVKIICWMDVTGNARTLPPTSVMITHVASASVIVPVTLRT